MISTLANRIRQNPLVSSLLLIAAILGGITKIVDFGSVYDRYDLPRWAWHSDVRLVAQQMASLEQQLLALEIDYRETQVRTEQRLLRETAEQIATAEAKKQPGADGLAELQNVLQQSIAQHQARLVWLLEKRKDP